MAYAGFDASGQPIVLPVPAQPGLPGSTGPAGADGRSAYEIAVAQGLFAGSEADFAAQLMARSADSLSRIAISYIPARSMVVDLGNGLCRVVDPTDPTQAGLVLGIVLTLTLPGTSVTIRQGDLVGEVFDFPGAGPLHIADDGSLTLTPRSTGFSQIVGSTPDGVHATIRLGQARPIVSLNSGIVVPPPTLAILGALWASAEDSPVGQPPGTFYRNGGALERTPKSLDPSIPTAAMRQALAQVWASLPDAPDGLGPGRFWLNGRALERVAPTTPSAVIVPPAFLAALGALWDGAPLSPAGLASGDYYRNGNALERIP